RESQATLGCRENENPKATRVAWLRQTVPERQLAVDRALQVKRKVGGGFHHAFPESTYSSSGLDIPGIGLLCCHGLPSGVWQHHGHGDRSHRGGSAQRRNCYYRPRPRYRLYDQDLLGRILYANPLAGWTLSGEGHSPRLLGIFH